MLRRLLLPLLLLLLGLPALRAEPLPRGGVDLWPQLRMHADPSGELTLAQALRTGFIAPDALPRANFGPRRGALWLQLELPAAAEPRHWLLEIDYPPLQRIDAWLLDGGEIAALARMGNLVPAAERPMRSRAHAWPLRLEPGRSYRVYLRVESQTAMVLPLHLHEADRYLESESRRLLLHGLIFGVALVLLVFSVANGLSLRDPLFGWYALLIAGLSLLFLGLSGLGHLLPWAGQGAVMEKLSPLGALLALMGGSLFARAALSLPTQRPRVARVFSLIALLGALAFLLSITGLLDYRQTSLAATLLGPPPTLLALFESLRMARQGRRGERRLALFVALGWLFYAGGSLCMALLLRGRMPVDFWTLHAFQIAALLEMFVWLRVLALRMRALRVEAERSALEQQTLRSMAHSDALTGLANRRGLGDAISTALARPDPSLALFLIDLDGFKAVNDLHGHEAGDALLQAVAQRLRGQLRGSDLVARLGGDEFVVLSPGLRDEDLAMSLGRKLVDSLAQPFTLPGLGELPVQIGCSIGLALAPADGDEAAGLLRRADAAMYAAKQAGKGRVLRR